MSRIDGKNYFLYILWSASKHANGKGHPVVASAELGERWLYCYPDDQFAEY